MTTTTCFKEQELSINVYVFEGLHVLYCSYVQNIFYKLKS